jgi:alpha-beta hydrolase superfamily lysophospholipase
MMQAADLTLAAPDGAPLFVYRWLPDGPAKAVVQVVHGLAEHAARYRRLAAALTAAGYAVYAGDLRGHGRTARSADELGLFALAEGWRKTLDDIWQINRRAAADRPGLPLVLLGHSMGSFLTQYVMSEHGEALAAVVLSGSNGKPPAIAGVGRLVARLERLRIGPRGHSALLFGLGLAPLNKPFAPARTPFDWLSRDPAEVDAYVADPLCGFNPRVQLWIDLTDALADMATPQRIARIPKHLPIYVVAGTRDPVSANTKGLERLLAAYRAAGLDRVAHRFYADGRHELFNETNREEVTRDLIRWLDGVLFPSRNAGEA